MPPLADLSNRRFGRLIALRVSRRRHRHVLWLCRCDCGAEHEVRAASLVQAMTTSCGCFALEKARLVNWRHGHSYRREYHAWKAMRDRCNNPKNQAYARYGGRGLRVAPEFDTIDGFLNYMGPCPQNYTLDRIDNDLGYQPGNVRWATMLQQQRNRSSNRPIEFGGHTRTLSEWAERTGIGPESLAARLRRGWSVERTLTAPLR